MGRVVMGALLPHPAILIEEAGGEERSKAQKTLQGLQRFCQDLLAANPSALVIISPHGPVFQDAVFILGWEKLAGSFANFGAPCLPRMSYINSAKPSSRPLKPVPKMLQL